MQYRYGQPFENPNLCFIVPDPNPQVPPTPAPTPTPTPTPAPAPTPTPAPTPDPTDLPVLDAGKLATMTTPELVNYIGDLRKENGKYRTSASTERTARTAAERERDRLVAEQTEATRKKLEADNNLIELARLDREARDKALLDLAAEKIIAKKEKAKAALGVAAVAAGIRNFRDLDLLDLTTLTQDAIKEDGTIVTAMIDGYVSNLKTERAYWFNEAPSPTPTPTPSPTPNPPPAPRPGDKPGAINWAGLTEAERELKERELFGTSFPTRV